MTSSHDAETNLDNSIVQVGNYYAVLTKLLLLDRRQKQDTSLPYPSRGLVSASHNHSVYAVPDYTIEEGAGVGVV